MLTGSHYTLVVISGPLAGTRFSLPAGEQTLGRGAACELSLPDSEMSRQHARLVVRQDGITFVDLGSANGSYVNGGRAAAPTELHPGDEIQVGGTRLVLEPVPEVSAPASVDRLQPQPLLVSPPTTAELPVPSEPAPPKGADEARCWFCQIRPPHQSNLVVELYRDVHRQRSLDGTRVRTTTTWRNTTVPVPRCPVCAAAHQRSQMLAKAVRSAGAILGALLGLLFVAAAASPRERNPATFIVVALVLGAIGLGLGWLVSLILGRVALPAGIHPARQAARFPAVEQRRAEGWRIGAKPPPELTGLFIFVGILLAVLLILFLLSQRRRF